MSLRVAMLVNTILSGKCGEEVKLKLENTSQLYTCKTKCHGLNIERIIVRSRKKKRFLEK